MAPILGQEFCWREAQSRFKRQVAAHAPRGEPKSPPSFYSLIESAKLCGVDLEAYLVTAARAALADRTAVALPHALLQ